MKKVYTTFSELPLEIVVGVRSFMITHFAEPKEIITPGYPATVEPQPAMAIPTTSRRPAAKSYRNPNKISKVNVSGRRPPVLVVPEPKASTKLKTPSLQNTRTVNHAPLHIRKQTKPRQDSLFKRFTLLIIDFLKERFVWARRKTDTTNAGHDECIAENHVFDEVLDVNVPRSEFERRAKFNNNQTSQEAGIYGNESNINKTARFPNHFEQEQTEVSKHMEFILSIGGKPPMPKLKQTNRKSNIK